MRRRVGRWWRAAIAAAAILSPQAAAAAQPVEPATIQVVAGDPVTVESAAPPVAPPSHTSSRTASWMFGVAAATDWATTIHSLEFHRGHENDPLINWAPTPAATVAIGAMLDVASFVLWRRLMVDHPRVADAGLYVASGFRLWVAARNEYRIAHSAGCGVPPCQYNCVAVFSRC